MKDYKRLTKWSELGTLHVFDINGKEIPLYDVSPVDTDNLSGRLADLEDKIESGELVPAAEDKNARHRAEVAERALSWLCDETMRDIRIIMHPTIGKRVRDKQELYDYCIEQAEREIEKKEERKE